MTEPMPTPTTEPSSTPGGNWRTALLPYAAALFLCAVCLTWTLELWHADLRFPLGDSGDCAVTQLCVVNLLERGAYYRCDRLAAPYGVDLRDFPMSENLHLGVLKLLALGTKNPYRVVNYFYLLTYFFVTLTALFTFRRFAVAPLPAVVAAVLYAFLPYHLYRGVGHLFLSGYYLVPLTVLVVLWLYLGRLGRQTGIAAESEKVLRWRWAGAVLICLLVSGAGVYYAFFGCFFLLTAAFGCALRQRRWGPLFQGGSLVLATGLGVVLNLLPSLFYKQQEGFNPDVAGRLKCESEIYGLKLSHLLLPIHEHRFPPFRQLRELYSFSGSTVQEGCYTAALGTLGALGFVFVVLSFLFGKRATGSPRLVSALGFFALCGLMLGTVGGVGTLFANFVSPSIRSYNRVSIYIGFFALFGVALFLTWLLDKARRLGLRERFGTAFCLLLLAGGVWDQTNQNMVPTYAANKAALDCRTAFVGQIEQRLQPDALVFQLPLVDFPESMPVNRINSYDHLRLYLVSHSLRWSHGTISGRYGAKVMATLAKKPVETVVHDAVAMGFTGLHVDRFGYADNGRDLEARLRALLLQEPLVSADGRDVFFDLSPYAQGQWNQYTPEQWVERQDWYRSPVVALWGAGADRVQDDWRWCRSPATLSLINPLQKTRSITLRFVPDFATPEGKPQEPRPQLTMTGAVVGGTVPVETGGVPFSLVMTVPPGRHDLRFDCDGRSMHDEHGRTLVFRLLNLAVVSDEAAPDAIAAPPITGSTEAKPPAN